MLDELKTAKKMVGLKQSTKAVKDGNAVKAFIATDAEERVTGKFKELCMAHGVPITYVNTMKELGKASGIDVGAAVVVIVNHEE